MTDVVLRKAPTAKVHEFIKSDQEVLFDGKNTVRFKYINNPIHRIT